MKSPISNQNLKLPTGNLFSRFANLFSESKIRRLSRAKAAPTGYKRIYHYHIRKTGGTSLVKMFHALSGQTPDIVYKQLIDSVPRRIVVNDYVYSGWERPLIEQGNYFHAFSHIPVHGLNLPPDTFTITCFRDPAKRVISHYRMLLQMSVAPKHPCFKIEGKWLGNGFDDFLDRIPRDHLANQIYMFDKDFNIVSALTEVQKLNHVMFLEDFDQGIQSLNQKMGIALKQQHQRKGSARFQPTAEQFERLKTMLNDEYEFLAMVKDSMMHQADSTCSHGVAAKCA